MSATICRTGARTAVRSRKRARDAGWNVTVATAPHASAAGLAAAGFKHLALPIERFRLNPLADARFLLAMQRLIGEARYDAIHLFTIKPLLIGGLAARFARPRDRAPRVIGTVAGLGRALDGTATRWRAAATSFGLTIGLGKAAAAVTFENEGDRDFYVKSGSIDQSRTHVLPGAGVDLQVFKPKSAGARTDVVTILHAGRLLRSKGVMDLVAAAKILKGRFGKRGADTDRGTAHRWRSGRARRGRTPPAGNISGRRIPRRAIACARCPR